MVEKHRAQLAAIEKARLVGLQSLAADLGRQSVTIEANANDEGHLYGSVGAAEVANALKRANFHIAADQVRLKGPLKELGLYTIDIHLGHEVNAEVKVWSCHRWLRKAHPSPRAVRDGRGGANAQRGRLARHAETVSAVRLCFSITREPPAPLALLC